MKNINACLLVGATLLLSSCIMTKTYTAEKEKMSIKDEPVIVLKNDGKKVVGSKKVQFLPCGMQLVTG